MRQCDVECGAPVSFAEYETVAVGGVGMRGIDLQSMEVENRENINDGKCRPQVSALRAVRHGKNIPAENAALLFEIRDGWGLCCCHTATL